MTMTLTACDGSHVEMTVAEYLSCGLGAANEAIVVAGRDVFAEDAAVDAWLEGVQS